MYSANKPNFGIVLGIIHTALDLLVKYLLYVVITVPRMLTLTGTIWLIEFAHIPLSIIINGIAYAYVHKKIVKIKVPFKQIFAGFLLPSAITYGLNALIAKFVFYPLLGLLGFIPAIISSLLLILASLFFVFFPLTAIFGGWDDLNLEEFRKAAYMSGPSKFIVLPMYKVLNKAAKMSRLHGKFQLPMETVIRDAQELLQIKRAKREELKEKHEKEI